MSDTVLVLVAVAAGLAGGVVIGVTVGVIVAGGRLNRAVNFLEDLLGLLELERKRLEALLGELEPGDEGPGRAAANQ